MSELRELLREAFGDERPSPGALERTLRRARRRERNRRLGTAALALVLFAAAGSGLWLAFRPAARQPAQPAPYANGRILFSNAHVAGDPRFTGDDGSVTSDLFLIQPDGTGLTYLTRGEGREFSPAWSPDGSQIAFQLFILGSSRSGLYVMDADGSNRVQLTDRANDQDPAWSPDGTRIAFARESREDTGEGATVSMDLFAIDADGSDLTQLTRGPENDLAPDWSPDGSRIAFMRLGREFGIPISGAPGAQIHVLDLADGAVTRLTDGTGNNLHPSWAPDGARILFSSDRDDPENQDLYVINADGTGLVRLTTDPGDDYFPSWSPDGIKIVYVSSHDAPEDQELIVTLDADGSDQRVVWSDPVVSYMWPDWEPVPVTEATLETPSPTVTENAAQLVGEVRCDGESITIVTPVVQAWPDGVHFRVMNTGDRYLLFGPREQDLPAGETREIVLSMPPGERMVFCYPESEPSPQPQQEATVEVVDPGGLWVSPDLECPGDTLLETIPFVSGPIEGDPEEVARGEVPQIRPNDALERAGYPASTEVILRVVRDGRTVGAVSLSPAGEDRWFMTGYRFCSG